MLETYFVKPQTAGRIRACWIGAEIERYAGWLAERGYRPRTVRRHVQALVAFGEFAGRRGASAPADLPAHVDDFVAMRVAAYRRGRAAAAEVRGPVEQMLTVILPGFERTGRTRRELPFARAVPGFFEYLAEERGLRPESIVSYRHHLAGFEAYLEQIGVTGLQDLSPAILSAFVAERAGAGLARTTVRTICGVLRVFLRYARRQGLLAADLSKAVEWPTAYQLSGIPRSISREQVGAGAGMTETVACAVEQFIAHKRAHGRKYHSEARELALLVDEAVRQLEAGRRHPLERLVQGRRRVTHLVLLLLRPVYPCRSGSRVDVPLRVAVRRAPHVPQATVPCTQPTGA